ncbi:MAG TPA: flagellar basal-body MS-ring/collar protein FliF [Bryobacteraceae bacterium]|nr:flagellar basal-body MS-ring/collar protein FliF [Bryobacteraceae bacterium]
MNQFNKLWAGLSLSQKISLIVAAIVTTGGLFAFSQWRKESDFRPMYTSMAPEDAAAVVDKLRQSGVEYRLADNGATVLVPSAKLAESRLTLAAAGLPKSGRIGFELFDKNNFGATDFVEHVNYKRALEGELERSVMSLAEVEGARVHLTLPKESVFLDQQEPAKAAVMVKLRPGAQLSQQNVLAITNLVAGAVEGLTPDGVSVVDMNGDLLSRPHHIGPADQAEASSGVLEFRQQLEHDLVTKIRTTLEPVLGPDRFRAGVSVDCDLTSADQQEETFDPTKSVMVSSQKSEDVMERGSTQGIPGTASNLPRGGAAPSAGAGGGTSRRTENVTFETSRVIRHTRIPQGTIKRMSIAVLVDQNVHWEGQGKARHRVAEPLKAETLQSIKTLIAAATGLNTDRGDQLIVENLPFESSLNPAPDGEPLQTKPPAPPPGPKWLQLWNQYKDYAGPIAIALIVLIFLLRLVIRMFTGGKSARPESAAELEPGELEELRPRLAHTPAAALAPPDEELDVAGRVRGLAQRDTAAAAGVLRMWMQEGKS